MSGRMRTPFFDRIWWWNIRRNQKKFCRKWPISCQSVWNCPGMTCLVCLRVCGVIGSLNDVLCFNIVSIIPAKQWWNNSLFRFEVTRTTEKTLQYSKRSDFSVWWNGQLWGNFTCLWLPRVLPGRGHHTLLWAVSSDRSHLLHWSPWSLCSVPSASLAGRCQGRWRSWQRLWHHW